MTKRNINNIMQKGSLMVEALALLGLITMVTPVMYKKAAERTTELQDINVATQMRTLNAALDSYVRNNFNGMEDKIAAGAKLTVNAKDDTNEIVQGVKAYLPAGFDITQSKYFDTENMKFTIERKENTDLAGKKHNTYTSAVLAPALNPLKLNRASKIATMIGVNGGTIKGTKFEGTQGAWNADPQVWFGVDPTTLKLGSLMSISNEVVAEGAQADTSKLLYRVEDDDPSKNTMMTNLLMDEVGIEGLTHLFGNGGNLFIGGPDADARETNLIVKGTTEIAHALTVKDGGIDVTGDSKIDGKATITGDADIDGKTTTASIEVEGEALIRGDTKMEGRAKVGLQLDVLGPTILNDTLNVTGDTTLGKLTAGDTTLGKLTAGDTTLGSLEVTGDAKVGGDLDVAGVLSSTDLHAKRKLTVGGETLGTGEIMTVEQDKFDVTLGPSFINVSPSSMYLETNSSYIALKPTQIEVQADGGTSGVLLSSGAADLWDSGGGHFKTAVTDTSTGDGVTEMTRHSGKIGLDKDKAYIEKGTARAIVRDKNIVLDSGATSRIDLDANEAHIKGKRGDFAVGDNYIHGIVPGSDFDVGFMLDGQNQSFSYQEVGNPAFKIDQHAAKLYDDEFLGQEKIILSRKGYIELPAPTADGTSGKNTGYIRARRLISDVPYYEHSHFHGDTATGGALSHKYDYYQVNPAYTSIMNDIKLASRGGARLSDILSDYVIKGIYVADNTYHAGRSEYGYADSDDNIDKPLSGDLFGEGLYWEFIPIENGAVKSGTILEAEQEDDNTLCNKEGECKIYECSSINCVASPWMGFVPAPQCPRGYLAVITTSPIRWRMAEVFYLTEEAAGWKDETGAPANYNAILGDLNSMPFGRGEPESYDPNHDSIKIRFNKYFNKANNPKLAHFKINDATAEDGVDHTHDTSSKAVTIQTNTWLNSSVDPVVDETTGSAYGWHVLMGFLYRPGDFGELLADLGYEASDMDAIYWNIFPVYAQEMASIATTYCAFVRNPGAYDNEGNLTSGGWNWDAQNNNSPVLDYNQLNPATYRDPTSGSRNPMAGGTRGTNWSEQVNDPSLPYDDAW